MIAAGTARKRRDSVTCASTQISGSMAAPTQDARDRGTAETVELTKETLEHYRQAIGASLPNVSQHLAVLRTAGLVERRRTGTIVVYRLTEPAIADACDIIHAIVARRLAPALPAIRPADGRAVVPALAAAQG